MRKWAAWGILVFAFIIVFFNRLSMGAVSDLVAGDMGLDNLQMAKLAAMTFYGYAIMQIPVGMLVDTFGVRKICSLGMAVTAAGSFILSFSSVLLVSYFARFMVGVGTSVIIISLMKVQADMFPDKMYSTLSGITSCFGNLGALLATYPLAFAAGIMGWRGSFKLLGAITVLVSVGILIFVKEDKNEDMISKKEERVQFKEVFAGLASVLKNKYTWPNFLIMLFFVGSMTAVLGLWGTAFLKSSYGMSIKEGSYYISFIIYGYIIGSPIVGRLSDMLGGNVKKIILPSSIVYALLWVYILVIKSGHPDKRVLPAIFFVMGMAMISHILAFSNVKEVNDIKYVGIATAVVNTGEFIGSGIISMLIGFIIDKGSSVEYGMIIVLVSAVLSIGAAILIKEKRTAANEKEVII